MCFGGMSTQRSQTHLNKSKKNQCVTFDLKAFAYYVSAKKTLDGSRRRGKPRKSWTDNIKEWTGQ